MPSAAELRHIQWNYYFAFAALRSVWSIYAIKFLDFTILLYCTIMKSSTDKEALLLLTHLIEFVYRLLWGDLFTLPVGGGIGISLMVVLLFTAGIWFTLRTRLLPVRLFRDMIAAVCEKNQNKEGLSSFQTLVVSTATRVGMGNLVGVVAAVSAGGAGAVFWMWVTALLGASTSFIEWLLAIRPLLESTSVP